MKMERLFIVKIGGNVLDNEQALKSFLNDFAFLKENKILVHGGGKIATKIGEQLGIKSNYVNGRRITDEATKDLVTMVYGGLVNKQLVAKLQSLGCNALGLTGADGNAIRATKRSVNEIDYGFVGDIAPNHVNLSLIQSLLDQNVSLVFAPLTHSGGNVLNTNADTIASVLATALSKYYDVRLLFCFEKNGVLADINNENSAIQRINKETYNELLANGSLADGILPKLENAFAAIDEGVKEVLIGHANDLIKNTTDHTIGTLITR
jgi:acetylglutamate kinase